MSRRLVRPLRAAAVVAVLLPVLAGCGGGSSGGDGGTDAGGGPVTVTASAAGGASAIRSLEPTPAAPSVGAAPQADAAGAVTFAGVTVSHALDLRSDPGLTSSSATPAPGLLVQDLVVGTGPAATTTSTATLHYRGVLYADGAQFDSNYGADNPKPEDLGTAVAGFAQGVGGTDGVTPMHVGGRRLLIFPSALGYGAVPLDAIPAHSSLVFVVDLLEID